jgi:hypothetical protein
VGRLRVKSQGASMSPANDSASGRSPRPTSRRRRSARHFKMPQHALDPSRTTSNQWERRTVSTSVTFPIFSLKSGRWRRSRNKDCVFAIKYSGHIDEEFII